MKKDEVKLTDIIGHSKAEIRDHSSLEPVFALRNFFQIPDPDTKLPLGIPATKQAETDQDFDVIIKREAAKAKKPEKDMSHYPKILKAKVAKLIRKYESYFDAERVEDHRDEDLLIPAHEFMEYLDNWRTRKDTFNLNIGRSEEWIRHSKFDCFKSMQYKLFQLKLIDQDSQWIGEKQDLAKFFGILLYEKFFNQGLKDYECRHFIEEHYTGKTNFLAEQWKGDRKPNRDQALQAFPTIKKLIRAQ